MRIIFLGTPEFSVPILEALIASKHEVVAVITAMDKPVGRGMKEIRQPAVKIAALRHDIPVLQPPNLKKKNFVETLRSYLADLQVVVAFRMLPEVVWNMPPRGTMNLHASLLPAYRGAAPINWAIIGGESVTGMTTFLLQHQIDTGDLILQKELDIDPDDTAGILHDRMMEHSPQLVLESIDHIISQKELVKQDETKVSAAPKIFTADCEIDWSRSKQVIHNHIRGLSPFPTAWTTWQEKRLKIFRSSLPEIDVPVEAEGLYVKDGALYHSTADGGLEILELQVAGKKRMRSSDFVKGYSQVLPEIA